MCKQVYEYTIVMRFSDTTVGLELHMQSLTAEVH